MSFVQLGSWNIEHLSSRRENPQSPYALADHIEMAGLEVLALQEVYVTHEADGERRNAELDTVCELLKEHLGTDWTYKIYPNRTAGDRSQLCALMWDTRRIEKTAEMRIDVPERDEGYPLWDRVPHAVKLTVALKRWRKKETGEWEQRDETSSLIVVPLHMKSNYGDEAEGRTRRALEAGHLVSQLDTVKATLGDESLILLGDTNILDRNEAAVTHFTGYGLRDLNFLDQATYPGYGGAPFDRVYVAKGRREFRYTRQYVLQSSSVDLHDRFLSDHYLIKASVKIYVDDADPREAR